MKTKFAIQRAGGRDELAQLLGVAAPTTYSLSWRKNLPPKHERYLRLARPDWFESPVPRRQADIQARDVHWLPIKTETVIAKSGGRADLARLLGVSTITTYHWRENLPPKHERYLRALRPDWFESREPCKREESPAIGARP